MTTEEKVENWFVPLSTTEITLKEAHSQLDEFGLEQEDVPLIIQLVENPKFDLPMLKVEEMREEAEEPVEQPAEESADLT